MNTAENGEPVFSSTVCLDTTSPTAEEIDYTRYVDDLFNYHFSINDNLTGGDGYRLRMGPIGSPERLTQGWIWTGSTGSYQERTVSFEEDFIGGYDCLEDGEYILFSFQVKDRSGNWSELYYSDPILVDRTAPGIPTVDKNRVIQVGETLYTQEGYFITKNDRVEGIAINGLDPESGIFGYRWAVREKGSSADLMWSELVDHEVTEDLTIDISDVILSGELALTDQKEYEVYVQLINGSGILSGSGVSPVLFADFRAPEFEVVTAASGLDTEDVEGKTGVIYNLGGDVNCRIIKEDGEILKVTYSLITPEDVEGEETTLYLFGSDVADFTVPFAPLDETAYGRYKLKLTLSDTGGYETPLIQDIRLNAPPEYALQNIVTHPMEPFSIPLTDWVKDIDSVTNIHMELVQKGNTEIWDQIILSDLNSLTYDHEEQYAGRSEYNFKISAEDKYGQRSSGESSITIVNTPEGALYTDEYWTGTHQITGPVIVPDGLSLNVDNGTTVLAVPIYEHGIPGIEVEPGGIIDHVGSATYELMDRNLDYFWGGLEIEGNADLDNITIRDAARGITLKSDKVGTISGTTFEDNRIGLHLLGVPPLISGCRFMGNEFYGIKEDDGSLPVVKDNLFQNNGYDYYDLDLTVLSADELNNLDSNTGNRGEN